MNKHEILSSLQSSGLSAELMQTIQEHLGNLPEALSKEDLVEFDTFLASLQIEEAFFADAYAQAATAVDRLTDGLVDNYENMVADQTAAMSRGATQLKAMLG